MNASDYESLENRFREDLMWFLVKLPPLGQVDIDAIPRIYELGEELTRVLKAQPLLSKALLWDIRAATKTLRAEAGYMKEHTERLNEMADRLDEVLSLLLMGECPEDRVSGVPRVA